MLWYGSFLNKNSTTPKFYNLKKRSHYFNYFIPNQWKLIILYNLKYNTYNIKIYSNLYYISIPITYNIKTLKFDPNTNQLITSSPYLNNFNKIYHVNLKLLLSVLDKPIFSKIKFKGKGYYIYKNYRNTITPQFGYSHRFYIYSYYVYIKFLSKNSLIMFGLNPGNIKFISLKVRKWRPLNIFTGRGVRFSSQIVYKKSGKVSSYR
jgi:large subunit ribosomal protein L6